jgi:hypothetical protein
MINDKSRKTLLAKSVNLKIVKQHWGPVESFHCDEQALIAALSGKAC